MIRNLWSNGDDAAREAQTGFVLVDLGRLGIGRRCHQGGRDEIGGRKFGGFVMKAWRAETVGLIILLLNLNLNGNACLTTLLSRLDLISLGASARPWLRNRVLASEAGACALRA